jgi:hypothetical protein
MFIKKADIKSITAVECSKFGLGQDGYAIRYRIVGAETIFSVPGRLTGAQAAAVIDTIKRDLARHGETEVAA